jgi:hypothetical protein
MFLTLKKVMDALFKGLSRRIIPAYTDGARSMTGGSRGLATRIQRICSRGIIRVWCGLHQLDLVMQIIFCAACDETFYAALTNVIGHLRRQQTFIAEMRGTCPLVAITRWMSMANVSTWLTESSHRARIIRHLDTRSASWKPSICWWITLHAVNALERESVVVFVSLQGLRTLLSQQRAQVNGLVATLCRLRGMVSSHIGASSQLDPATYTISACGEFYISNTAVRSFLEDISMWVFEKIQEISPAELQSLLQHIGEKVFVEAASGITRIVSERDECNSETAELPAVLPMKLVRITMRDLSVKSLAQKIRLEDRFDQDKVASISDEFASLKSADREEQNLREAMDNCDEASESFEKIWSLFQGLFPVLHEFCSGLASAFPNIAIVEAEFSILGWEKNVNREILTDFLSRVFYTLNNGRSLRSWRSSWIA